jgi:hypothetical protein
MKINPKLRQDLIKYNLNFPTDARTKEYKAQVEKYKAPELYKLFLQSKVATAKIIQKEADKKAKKEAAKKAREEAKAEKAEAKLRKRYIGSITLKMRYIGYKDGEKFSLIKTKTLPIDIIVNPSNLKAQIKNIIDDYINEETRGGLNYEINDRIITDIKYLSHTENIKQVNDNPTPLNKTRMKEAQVGIYDGYDTQEWNTNTGRCVFDYIINKYGNIDGFKKVCNYMDLNRIFNRHREVPLDLLDIGVNTDEIRNFCILYNIPMYAVDENENTFCQYIPESRNKKCSAMIYLIANNHFHPITDNTKIHSIRKRTSMINNINSDIIDNSYKSKNETEGNDIKEDMSKVVFVDDINAKLLSKLEDNKIPTKIVMKNKDLTAFSYGGYKYVQNDNIDVIKKLCDNMEVKYTGQGITTLLSNIYKEAIGNDKLPKSTHNPYVFDTLLKARKSRARCGAVVENHNSIKDLVAWDIVKCYTSCMYETSEDWIRLDYNDTWEDYDGELKLGIYYVNTRDTTLFKKSGYYSTCIIKKAISEGIDFHITKQLIASYKEDKDIFTKIIDVIMKYSNEDTNISKSVINLMSGLLGQSDKTVSKGVHINNDINQIFNFLNKYYHLDNGIMINKIENTNYYMYGFNQKVIFNESNMPMYIQVLDESNIKLYDMIKKMGGQLVAYKVDCVVASGVNTECPNDTKWGGYRSCEVPNITATEIINDVEFKEDGEWEDYNFNDSDEWESIMKVMIENKGLLLQASAGNGKTYTAKMIASKLGDRVKIIAPTNKAALNIGGSTIHRFLQINEQGYIKANKLKKIKEDYDYIIIDEISMISKDLWRRLCLLKQEAPNIIFLLLGDEKQCPPVEDDVNIKDYFNHPSVKYICNYNRNVLNVRKRYDETLYNLLEDVDAINVRDIKKYPKLITDRNICYYNKTRIRINKMWNDKKKKVGDLFIPALIDNPKTQDMYVYNELPVIAMKTKHEGDDLLFANSETFVVYAVGDNYISIYNERPDDNGNKSIYLFDCPIEDFNKYFLMNYCSTTHKSQGETIMDNYTIYDWNAMDTKIRYTALSRARKIEQVCFN